MPDYDRRTIAEVYYDSKEALNAQMDKMQDHTSTKEAFSVLLEGLKKLNEQIGKCSVREPSTGQYPDFTAKERDKLLRTYKDVWQKLNSFMELPDKTPAFQALKKTLTQFPDIMSVDMRIMSAYQPEKGLLPLPHIMSRARIHTVNAGNTSLNKADGGNMSNRVPISYTDASGHEMHGFFTVKSVVNTQGDYAAILQGAKKKFPELKNTLDSLLDGFIPQYEANRKKTFDGSDMQRNDLIYLLMRHHFDDKTVSMNAEKLYEFISQCRQKYAPEEIPEDLNPGQKDPRLQELAMSLAEPLGHLFVSTHMNQSIGITNGDRVDSRNSAMSAVADMLGKPELLARSIPMQMKINGQLVEGTFMESAKGMDINHANDEASLYNEDNFSGMGLRTMADLQILDFICGNIDRHVGNMMYQFPTDGNPRFRRLEGVQGIDNDLSFGNTVPTDRYQGRKEMAAISNMKVISESMAKAVIALRPEELAYRLHGLQLTTKQIEAAQKRLNLLRKCIEEDQRHFKDQNDATQEEFEKLKKTDISKRSKEEKNRLMVLKKQRSSKYLEKDRIRIVPDQVFENFSLQELLPESEKGCNIFSTAQKFFNQLRIEENSKKGSIYTEFKEKSRIGADSTRQYAQEARDFQKLLKDVTGWRGSSPEFKKLKKALDEYTSFCNDIAGQVMDLTSLMNRNKFLADIRNKCRVYLAHKKEEKDLNEYAMNRVNAVAKLLWYTKDAAFVATDEELRQSRRYDQEQITALNKQMAELNQINEENQKAKTNSKKPPAAAESQNGPAL